MPPVTYGTRIYLAWSISILMELLVPATTHSQTTSLDKLLLVEVIIELPIIVTLCPGCHLMLLVSSMFIRSIILRVVMVSR